MAWDDAIRDIQAERLRQINSLGYTAEHDDQHTSAEFASIIGEYTEEVITDQDADGGLDDGRMAFVKIAALAVAAIERIDRA